MLKRLFSLSAVLFILAAAAPLVHAELQRVGEVSGPHGFPLWYEDSNNLALELCLPADQVAVDAEGIETPAGAATRPDLCLFDPQNPDDPESLALGVGGESFWWAADAQTVPLVAGGKSILVLALEAAFAAEEPKNGDQMSFGRVRVRVDVPAAGDYRILYPYGQLDFPGVTVTDGINYTADIGAINFLSPELGFVGALNTQIGPFLTWPEFENEASLQVAELDPETGEPTGAVLEQYVGDPGVPHEVVGSPIADNAHLSGFQNYFAVQQLQGEEWVTLATTDLFTVSGKVFAGGTLLQHIYPDEPQPKLFAVGPVNRNGLTGITPLQPEGITAGTDIDGYPVGYPIWYQDTVLVTDPETGEPVLDEVTGEQLREGGVRLTICPPSDAMCLSAPVDFGDPGQVELRTGEEAFWWAGEAFINEDTPDVQNLPAGLDAILVLALEAAFGGDESVADGNQVGFGRLRIRIDTPEAGTYTITHPYGTEVFENVPAGRRAINMTRDIMIADPADPDSSFAGALFSDIGHQFLAWDTFDPTLLANDPLLQREVQALEPDGTPIEAPVLDPDGNPVLDEVTNEPVTAPVMNTIHYLGDPGVEHVIVGSPTGNNFFRIEGPDGIDVQTSLFAVSGKVFDEATFQTIAQIDVPVALPDAATTPGGTPVIIDVLANDTVNGDPVDPAAVTGIVVLPAGPDFGPDNGTAVAEADQTVSYTPNAGFDGIDTFAYTVSTADGTSNQAIVSVTVLPVETITTTTARFETRRLRLDIGGTSNFDGTTLTIHAGDTLDGPVIGTALVSGGKWRFRGTATANLTAISIVSNSADATTLLNQPLQVR